MLDYQGCALLDKYVRLSGNLLKIYRRGKPSHLYNDSGTGFLGESNELRELGRFVVSNDLRQNLNHNVP